MQKKIRKKIQLRKLCFLCIFMNIQSRSQVTQVSNRIQFALKAKRDRPIRSRSANREQVLNQDFGPSGAKRTIRLLTNDLLFFVTQIGLLYLGSWRGNMGLFCRWKFDEARINWRFCKTAPKRVREFVYFALKREKELKLMMSNAKEIATNQIAYKQTLM